MATWRHCGFLQAPHCGFALSFNCFVFCVFRACCLRGVVYGRIRKTREKGGLPPLSSWLLQCPLKRLAPRLELLLEGDHGLLEALGLKGAHLEE